MLRNILIMQSTLVSSDSSARRPVRAANKRKSPGLLMLRNDLVGALDAVWQQQGDLANLQLGPRPMKIISNPVLARALLLEKKHVFHRPTQVKGGTALTPLLGLSVLTTDGDSWLIKRRIMQPIFHRTRIQAMGDKMAAAGADMLARWQAKSESEVFNLVEETKFVTLDIINRTMFSTNVMPAVDDVGHAVDIALTWLTANLRALIRIPVNVPTPANRRYLKAKSALDTYIYGLIAERRANAEQHGDLLDMLLSARDEDTGLGMTDDEVRNEVITVYGAGHETTALALAWTWHALNENPDVLAKLQHELDNVLAGRPPTMADLPKLPYTLAVFEESMRLYPPVPFTVRIAMQDTTLGDTALPKDQLVGLAITNVHRHPDYWPQPEKFTPERFLPENKATLNRDAYIPFLTGPHLCIGNSFALMEGQLLIAMMAQRFTVRELAGQNVEKLATITMRPKHGLMVRLERR